MTHIILKLFFYTWGQDSKAQITKSKQINWFSVQNYPYYPYYRFRYCHCFNEKTKTVTWVTWVISLTFEKFEYFFKMLFFPQNVFLCPEFLSYFSFLWGLSYGFLYTEVSSLKLVQKKIIVFIDMDVFTPKI